VNASGALSRTRKTNNDMSDTQALRRDPNFTWLMSGGVISALGDQFTLIALPWLVLQLTGDPLALGVMVAAMGIPRAVLILFGGALVDRYSPKNVLMLTKHANTVLLAILAALVLSGNATLPLVAALGIGLSVASAFSIPAGTSMLAMRRRAAACWILTCGPPKGQPEPSVMSTRRPCARPWRLAKETASRNSVDR